MILLDWVLFFWIGFKGGIEYVQIKVDELCVVEIFVSAIWLEDWFGEFYSVLMGNNLRYWWIWDEEYYFGFLEMTVDLYVDDLCFLVYFNFFVLKKYVYWDICVEEGYLFCMLEGEIYEMIVVIGKGSVLDLINLEVVVYF